MSRLNTGSVYQIKSGRQAGKWAAAVTLPNGKRRVRLADTAAEAERLKRALLAELEAAPAAANGPLPTVAEHLATWLLYTVRPSVRPSTFEAYQYKVALLVPLIGARRLDRLTPADLRAAYARLATQGHPAPSPKRRPKTDERGRPCGLSPTSIKNAHVVLRAALEQAYRDGLIRRNVADLVTPPRKAEFDPAPLSREEALILLDAIADHRHGPLWTFMLGTGCRIGEAAALWWDDVDLTRARVTIHYTLTWELIRPGVRQWKRTPVKTKKSRRTLALPAVVVAALRQQRIANTEARLAAADWTEHGFVFPNTTGGPIRANHVLKAWHVALKNAGLKPRRLHDLRASTATLLFGDGFETRAVADQLGHSSTAMTENRYIGAVPEMLRQAASRLDAILTPDDAPSDAASAES